MSNECRDPLEHGRLQDQLVGREQKFQDYELDYFKSYAMSLLARAHGNKEDAARSLAQIYDVVEDRLTKQERFRFYLEAHMLEITLPGMDGEEWLDKEW